MSCPSGRCSRMWPRSLAVEPGKDCVLDIFPQGIAFGIRVPKTISFDSAVVMLRIGRMAGSLSLRLLSQTKLRCNFVCKIRSAPSTPMRLSSALLKETVSDRQRKARYHGLLPAIQRPALRQLGYSLPPAPLPLVPAKVEVPAAHGSAPGQVYAATRRVPRAGHITTTGRRAAAGIGSRGRRVTSTPEIGGCTSWTGPS